VWFNKYNLKNKTTFKELIKDKIEIISNLGDGITENLKSDVFYK
jgi:hypothetical protein